jgi:glycosyltransferase involved in cell wall biosynthesis
MKKRILIIGHTYTVSSNRDKIRRLARQGDFEIHCLVPLQWAHQTAGLQVFQRTAEDKDYSLYALPVFRSGNNKRFLFRGILGVLTKVKPDIIHLDEEPFNRVTFQIVLLTRLFFKGTRIILFTWENIYKRFKIHYRLIEQYNITRADLIICGNREARAVMEKKGASARLAVMPQYGVDLESYRKPRIPSDRVRVGYIGRMVPEKGVELLIEAFNRIDTGKKSLLLVGAGPLENSIPARPDIRLMKWVAGSRIPEILRRLDILVLPSYGIRNWKEQFGHILIEAMAAGVAVLGSSSGEIPHVIGRAGLVFRERDANDLFKKLSLLFRNKRLIAKYSRLGQERVRTKYTNEVLIRETVRLYGKLSENA